MLTKNVFHGTDRCSDDGCAAGKNFPGLLREVKAAEWRVAVADYRHVEGINECWNRFVRQLAQVMNSITGWDLVVSPTRTGDGEMKIDILLGKQPVASVQRFRPPALVQRAGGADDCCVFR